MRDHARRRWRLRGSRGQVAGKRDGSGECHDGGTLIRKHWGFLDFALWIAADASVNEAAGAGAICRNSVSGGAERSMGRKKGVPRPCGQTGYWQAVDFSSGRNQSGEKFRTRSIMSDIRRCREGEKAAILAIVNAAAEAYRRVIRPTAGTHPIWPQSIGPTENISQAALRIHHCSIV
jgi:hypothetical protein